MQLKKKILTTKNCLKKRFLIPCMIFKKLVANKISTNTANDDKRDFVFNLMDVYNMSSFFKRGEIKDLGKNNLYEKAFFKALEVLLKREKSTEGVKHFPKNLKNTLTEIEKVFY